MTTINVSDEERKTIQNCELQLLREFDRICRKNNLKYSVAYGTMIGAVRHNGFIPWDDDIDVWMLRSDIEKFKDYCQNELRKEYFYQTNETDSEYYYLIDKIRDNNTIFKESFVAYCNMNHGVYIDIFPLDNMPNGKIERILHYIHFRFYRSGLMAKYLDIKYRTGIKRIIARIARIIYYPFSLKFLYNKANKVAMMYKKRTNYLANLASASGWKDVFPQKIFSEMIEIPFEDMYVMCIKDYDEYLTKIYGDYMTIPPVEKRTTRHDLTELKL